MPLNHPKLHHTITLHSPPTTWFMEKLCSVKHTLGAKRVGEHAVGVPFLCIF